MAEVFTGDLSQIRLVDILNLLILEGKTGKVTLKTTYSSILAMGASFTEPPNPLMESRLSIS